MLKELENMVGIIKFFFNITSLFNIREFRQRFFSTIVLSLILLLLIWLGNPFITIIFSLLFSLIFFEYENLTLTPNKKLLIFKIILLQSILFLFTIFEIYNFQVFPFFVNNLIFYLSFSIFINVIFLIFCNANLIKLVVSTLIILSLFLLIGILQKPNGIYLFLYIVILVSTMDIFAYFGGKFFGKNKIIPKISKGKTIEGTLIGLISTLLMSFLIKELIHQNIINSLIFGFMISILAFLGDMIESFFKRNIGVKDSGKLIPGHGGLMDRFDGYFLVIPFSYFFIN